MTEYLGETWKMNNTVNFFFKVESKGKQDNSRNEIFNKCWLHDKQIEKQW